MPSPHNLSEPYERNRLPTLFEVLNLRTRAPVDLWSFYVFMREQYRGVEYLDFWLDVVKHLSMCRDYVRGIRESQLTASSRDSSVLLDNLIHDDALTDSDSRRLSAFLRGEESDNQPSFSRLSALVGANDLPKESPLQQQQQPNHPLRYTPANRDSQFRFLDANIPNNSNNLPQSSSSSNLQIPRVTDSGDHSFSAAQSPSSNQRSSASAVPSSGSLQPPNTSAIAAAWAQEKRRMSGSPIRVVMSDGRDASRPSSMARDFRSSSVYDESDNSSPTHPRNHDRIPISSSSGGVSISAPSAVAVAPTTPTLDVSTTSLVSPVLNRPNISSSLYNQGLSATPQIPPNSNSMNSTDSYYANNTTNNAMNMAVPATASTHANNHTQYQNELEKQETHDRNNLLLQAEHEQHHLNNKRSITNPNKRNKASQLSRENGAESPVLSFVSRSDIKQSTHYILVTYFIPGAEREIVLPQRIMKSVRKAIEEDGRDDPEVFDEAREYVFQAMQQEAFRAFLAAKALGNTTPFGSVVRLIIGLLSTFAAFWVGFILIFLDWQPKQHRLFLIIPFAFASYGIISGLYNLDPILAFLGFSETGPFKMIRIKEPYVRSLLVKRALFVTMLIILLAAAFVVIFSLVPGKRL